MGREHCAYGPITTIQCIIVYGASAITRPVCVKNSVLKGMILTTVHIVCNATLQLTDVVQLLGCAGRKQTRHRHFFSAAPAWR